MSSYITSLIKFTDHPDDFINGILFCNTWGYFDALESPGIGDPSELTQSVLNTEVDVPILNRRYTFRIVDPIEALTPVFCMYAHYSRKYMAPPILRLHESLLEDLGKYEWAVVVIDVKEFLRRVNAHLPDFCYSEVSYIDYSNLRGRTIYNPILKKDKLGFGHQQEFRFYNLKVAITQDKDLDTIGKTIISGTFYGDTLAEKFPTESMEDIVVKVPVAKLFEGAPIDLVIDWNYCHKRNLVKEYPLPTSKP